MSTVSPTHSALGDLVAWNEPAPSTASATTVQQAQQTVAQTPENILASLAPANTSIYGAAPAVDSLLGNIGTSASLSALAQINASRTAATQIDPFPSTGDAISFATESEAASTEALVQSALGSVNANTSALLAAYYSQPDDSSEAGPQLEVTA